MTLDPQKAVEDLLQIERTSPAPSSEVGVSRYAGREVGFYVDDPDEDPVKRDVLSRGEIQRIESLERFFDQRPFFRRYFRKATQEARSLPQFVDRVVEPTRELIDRTVARGGSRWTR